MVRVSGVPYDVEPEAIKPAKKELSQSDTFYLIMEDAHKVGVNKGLDIAIAYLNELHKTHENLHSFYKFAASQLENKKL